MTCVESWRHIGTRPIRKEFRPSCQQIGALFTSQKQSFGYRRCNPGRALSKKPCAIRGRIYGDSDEFLQQEDQEDEIENQIPTEP